MKYILMHNLDDIVKEKTLKSYLNEGYNIIYEDKENTIIKNFREQIEDEETYIKITISHIKKTTILDKARGKIIDITKAFEYAKKKGKYNLLNNKFDWHIRNIIIKETLKNE